MRKEELQLYGIITVFIAIFGSIFTLIGIEIFTLIQEVF